MNIPTLAPASQVGRSPGLPLLNPAVILVQASLFTAALVHELRNPLTNINLAVELLGQSVNGVQEKALLAIILRASGKVNSLVNDLVSIVVERKDHSLHQLLDDVLLQAADGMALKNIRLIKEYSGTDYTGNFESDKMKIAIANIVNNAIDAMQGQGGELKIGTSSLFGNFILRIEDNGCGISRASLEHIFDPYFTQKAGGLGIGLAASYEILKASQVEITVESELQKGTRFTLVFAGEKCLNQHHPHEIAA